MYILYIHSSIAPVDLVLTFILYSQFTVPLITRLIIQYMGHVYVFIDNLRLRSFLVFIFLIQRHSPHQPLAMPLKRPGSISGLFNEKKNHSIAVHNTRSQWIVKLINFDIQPNFYFFFIWVRSSLIWIEFCRDLSKRKWFWPATINEIHFCSHTYVKKWKTKFENKTQFQSNRTESVQSMWTIWIEKCVKY